MNSHTAYFLNEKERVFVSSLQIKAGNPELEPIVVIGIGDVSIHFPNAESVLAVMEQIAKNMAEMSWSNHYVGEFIAMPNSSFLISAKD